MTLSPLLWPFVLFSYRVFLPGNGNARGGDPDVMAEDALFRGYWPGLGLSEATFQQEDEIAQHPIT